MRRGQREATRGATIVGPLDGVRVVELASFLAGPSATALMADMGADVVKIERPRGDDLRGNQQHLQAKPHINYVYEVDNRGKRSIVIDPTRRGGVDALHRIVAQADVFVTNLTPGRARRQGVDFDTIAAANPRIVYAQVTGYGATGPEADRPGFDSTAYWARSGVMAVMGEAGSPIVQSRGGQGDHPTGVTLLAAILAALRLAERRGEAQHVDVSLQRAGLWSLATEMQQVLNIPGANPGRFNRYEHGLLIRNAYQAKDGRWFMLTMHDVPRYWPRLCRALERPDWAEDPRFLTTATMLAHGAELMRELEAAFLAHDLAHWAKRLDATGCVWAPAATPHEVARDEQLRATSAFCTLHDADDQPYEVVSTPFQIHTADVRPRSRSPLIGEHSQQILREAGFTDEEIADLAANEVLG